MMKRRITKVPRHLIGGVAFTHGVVLHSPDAVVIATRLPDGTVATNQWKLLPEKPVSPLIHLFGIRGLWLLWRTIVLNSQMRAFVDMHVKQFQQTAETTDKKRKKFLPSSLVPGLLLLVALIAYAALLFIIQLISDAGLHNSAAVESDVVTLVLTGLLLTYIIWRGGIWEYMGYHGAEHQAIAAYEQGRHTEEAIEKAWPFQNRCGAAVVSYVAILLAGFGYLWPDMPFLASILVAIGLFSLSYEIVMFLDHYNDTWWAKILSLPGVLLQFLVARAPRPDQSEVAAQALFELIEESGMLKAKSKIAQDMLLA